MENRPEEYQLKRFKKIQELPGVEDLWTQSHTAEEQGDVARALKLQEQIVFIEDCSYASVFRMAWLYYLAGDLRRSLDYYHKAWEVSEGREWPLYGMRNCYQAMGDSSAVNRVSRKIQLFDTRDVEEKSVRSDCPDRLSACEKECLLTF